MSYQEKKTIVSIVSGVLLLAAYYLYIFSKSASGNLDNLKFWATSMLVFIGIAVVALIIIQIVFHILLSVAMAVKQKLEDESCDDKAVENSIEQEMVEDERDKLIELKANKIGYALAGAGFLGGLVALALGASAVVMLNILFLSSGAGGIAEGLVQLRFYRRGI